MPKAVSRAIGGSDMAALPKPLLAHVRRYTLQKLLVQCDFRKRATRAVQEWQSALPAGKEML